MRSLSYVCSLNMTTTETVNEITEQFGRNLVLEHEETTKRYVICKYYSQNKLRIVLRDQFCQLFFGVRVSCTTYEWDWYMKRFLRDCWNFTRWLRSNDTFRLIIAIKKFVRKIIQVEVTLKETNFKIKFGNRRVNLKSPILDAWSNPITVTMCSSVLWIIFAIWDGQCWYR